MGRREIIIGAIIAAVLFSGTVLTFGWQTYHEISQAIFPVAFLLLVIVWLRGLWTSKSR